MRARRWLLVFACAVGSGPPAQAADDPDAAVVARDGTVELVASDRDAQVCLAVRDVDTELHSGGCGEPQPGVATPSTLPSDGPQIVGVAAPAEATTVEVRRLGKLVGRGVTVAGEAYRGSAAGSLRFALVRLAPGTRASGLRVQAKDASGSLIAVLDSGGERLIDRHRLLSGRVGRVSWSMHVSHESALESTVADLARERVSQCVSYEIRAKLPGGGAAEGPGGGSDCTSGTLFDDLALDTGVVQARELDRCAPTFRLMHGQVRASVRRVTVLLGDGRRRVAPTAALGDGISRAWALAIAPGDAVRSVTLESKGAPGRLLPQRLAPVAVGCAVRGDESFLTGFIFGFGGSDLPAVAPAGPVTVLAGPPAVRIADGPDDTLCLALGDTPFTALGCELVTPSFSRILTVSDDYVDPHAIVYAVPGKVALVRLSSKDGKTAVGIPAVEAPGYAGRYAGYVRFAATTISRYYDLPRLELLDGAGRLLYREDETRISPQDETTSVLAPRRIAGRVGAPSLWQTRWRASGTTLSCLALTAGPRPAEDDICEAYRSDESVLLDASCVTRRLTVAVAVASGTRVLAEVGTAAPRRLALRDGAGVLTLPTGSSLRALTFVRKGRARRVRLDAPPGARQCGWSASPSVDEDRAA